MAPRPNPTSLAKHSLMIAGHRTSVSLEHAFWTMLKRIAARRDLSVAGLVAEIDASRGEANLSSAIRVYLLDTLTKVRAETEVRAGPAPPAR